MDPISIVLIVFAGAIVISAAGRFISKKYHSYQSRSHDHEVELTTEENFADGASKKTTVKFHGKNHGVNISDEERQERGDPEAIKALTSLVSLFSMTPNLSSAASSVTESPSSSENKDSKKSIVAEGRKALKSLDTFTNHSNAGDTEESLGSARSEVSDHAFTAKEPLNIIAAVVSKVFKPVKVSCDAEVEEIKQDVSSSDPDPVEINDRAGNESPTSVSKFTSSVRLDLSRISHSSSGEFFDARSCVTDAEEDDNESLNVTSVSGDSSPASDYCN